MTKRVLAFGDVHGCHRALVALLGLVAAAPSDTLVFVGDVVDRGPATKQVIDQLLTLRETNKLVLIMGNHEEMLRDALSGRGPVDPWLDAGGRETVESYGGSMAAVPPDHIRFLLSAQPFWETDTEIFVHAAVESAVSLRNQTAQFLRWKHLGGSERPHISGKRVICGHTPQKDGIPFVGDGWVCIDTFVSGGKWLTCLDVESNHVWQAAETGQTREFPLARHA